MSVGLTLSPTARARCCDQYQREAPRADVGKGERPEPGGLGGEVGGRPEQDAPREDEHRRQRRRPEDRPKVVERVDPETQPIQAARRVERETEDDERCRRRGRG